VGHAEIRLAIDSGCDSSVRDAAPGNARLRQGL
jgi:hypothetical protein